MENNITEYATRSSKKANQSNNIEWRNYNDTLEYNDNLGIARVKGTDVTFRAKIDEKGRLIEYRESILPDYTDSDFALNDFDDAELEEEEDFDEDSIKEIYKPVTIKGFEGLYEVSNVGLVRSVRTGKILKNCLDKDGYCRVGLHKDGVQKNVFVHRLVAYAFIPNPNGLPEINHINECKTDNRIDNLEWCTREYNNNYGTRNERAAKAQSKTVEQLDENGNVLATYLGTNQVERVLGFFNNSISQACRKGVKRYGYYWRYKTI